MPLFGLESPPLLSQTDVRMTKARLMSDSVVYLTGMIMRMPPSGVGSGREYELALLGNQDSCVRFSGLHRQVERGRWHPHSTMVPPLAETNVRASVPYCAKGTLVAFFGPPPRRTAGNRTINPSSLTVRLFLRSSAGCLDLRAETARVG